MTPPTIVSVVNQSQRVSDAEVEAMTAAVMRQLSRDVAPFYGLVPAMEFVPRGGTPIDFAALAYVIDEPDIDGALGYHDEDEDGRPYIKVFVNPTLDHGGAVLTGADAVSVTLSHEVLELVGDSPANKWVDGPDGRDYAYELCDAVEGDAYELDGVSVSNFVLPAFFDPRAEEGSRMDYLFKLQRPFTMTPGGYQIVRTEPGRVGQVFARTGAHCAVALTDSVHFLFGPEVPEWRRQGKVDKYRKLGRRLRRR